MIALVFPGQGAQFPGMGNDLVDISEQTKSMFKEADKILGFGISAIMQTGTVEELTRTNVTQPAIFIYSVILSSLNKEIKAEQVAGHSLGEFSALVANGSLSYESGLKLVALRAAAMQKATEMAEGTMAAVLGMEDHKVEEILSQFTDDIVVPANYNSPGQLVISGSKSGVQKASDALQQAGAKRVIPLNVGGAFHSPLMKPAQDKLADAIEKTSFEKSGIPILQNYDARPSTDVALIKQKLVNQLTSPVRWTQSVQNMIGSGCTGFYECGPGKVLSGLIKKIDRSAKVDKLAV